MKTQGEMEAELSLEFGRFAAEFMGRGPGGINSFLVDAIVLIRARGAMTEEHRQLYLSENGHALLKRMRCALTDHFRPQLQAIVESVTGCRTVGFFHDIDPACEEEVVLFSLDAVPECRERKSPGR